MLFHKKLPVANEIFEFDISTTGNRLEVFSYKVYLDDYLLLSKMCQDPPCKNQINVPPGEYLIIEIMSSFGIHEIRKFRIESNDK
jgi:hypothetical protein